MAARPVRRNSSHGIGEPGAEPPVWHGVVAGSIAGAVGVLIGHAFDTAKVQAQVGKDASFAPMSPREFLKLYRGILPPLLSTGAIRSLYFGVYEFTRPRIAAAIRRPDEDLGTVFLAGAATGLITAPVTAPMQRLKLVQQVEGGSLSSCFRRLVVSGGLMHGLGLHSVLETIGSGCYLVAYAWCKEQLRRHGGSSDYDGGASSLDGDTSPEPLALRILSGGVAGICGWISIYPLDVLRSRVMSRLPRLPPPPPAETAALPGMPPRLQAHPAPAPGIFESVAMAARETYAHVRHRPPMPHLRATTCLLPLNPRAAHSNGAARQWCPSLLTAHSPRPTSILRAAYAASTGG